MNLVTIPEPTCDGKETWKRFDNAASPDSFSYPASWHVKEDREGIWLTCPDPSEIAYSQGVVVTMGQGDFQGPPELLKCGDKWIYGTSGSGCNCEHPDKIGCDTAKTMRSGSATVLDVGEHEWRIYCHDFGYVGEGYGEDRIILLPHSWVEISAEGRTSELIDRLVDSVAERASNPRK